MPKFDIGNILYNRVVLYFFVIVSLLDLVYFFHIGDKVSTFTFITLGFLTSFFSKNMIVILSIALAFTHLLKYGVQNTINENFEVGTTDDIEKDHTHELKTIMNSSGNTEYEVEDQEFDVIKKKNTTQPVVSSKKENLKNKKDTLEDIKPSKYSLKNDSESDDNNTEISQDLANFKKTYLQIMSNMKEMEPLIQNAEGFIEKYKNQ